MEQGSSVSNTMSCPICDSREFHPVGKKENWLWVTCAECQLIHLNPMPTDVQLNDYYSKYYANKKNIKNSLRKIGRFKRKIWPVSFLSKVKSF